MNKKQREFMQGQLVEYYVMWALEGDRTNTQACWIQMLIEKEGVTLNVKQVSGALQRLKNQGLVSYDGCWQLAVKANEVR